MQIPAQLYRDIIGRMPIACVDLMVLNPGGDVLLLRRRNTPARNLWWFPGGRIFYGESRRAAVARKLSDECGLVPQAIEEMGTHELQLERDDGAGVAHSITTVYRVAVGRRPRLQLDAQSSTACWRPPGAWLDPELHPFIRRCLTLYGRCGDD